MAAPNGDEGIYRFSTDDFPAHERLEACQEIFGRTVAGVDTTPLSDAPFRVDLTVRALPGLTIIAEQHSPLRMTRTRALLADGDDGVVLSVNATSSVSQQFGRETALEPGDGVFFSNADIGTHNVPAASRKLGVRLSRSRLLPHLRNAENSLMRRIPRDTAALGLLRRYLALLGQEALSTLELQHAAVSHIYDLAAVALGPTRDAAEGVAGRGVAAARLTAIKADILKNLGRFDLSLTVVAKRHGITPRYISTLFEREGTSFSHYVREHRLARAFRLLTSADHSHALVSAIAYEAGFGDVSNFNRAFRSRYGASPSEVRNDTAADRRWAALFVDETHRSVR